MYFSLGYFTRALNKIVRYAGNMEAVQQDEMGVVLILAHM
jgi:hypothetical protein